MVDDLWVEQQLAHEWSAPGKAEWEGDAKKDWERGFFDGEPDGAQIQQAESTRKDDGDEAENGEKIESAFLGEAPDAKTKRQEQCDDECPGRAEPLGLAQCLQRERGQDDGEQ